MNSKTVLHTTQISLADNDTTWQWIAQYKLPTEW